MSTQTESSPYPSQARKPGRWRYVLAVLVIFVSFGVMGAVLAVQLPKVTDAFQRVIVPGEAELQFEPGAHTIYLELISVVDGEIFRVEEVSDLRLVVVSPNEEPISLEPVAASSSYTGGGRHGQASMRFEVPEAGSYRVLGRYPEGVNGPRTVIAIAGPDDSMLGAILPAILVVFVGGGLAIWLIIATWRARRRATAAPA